MRKTLCAYDRPLNATNSHQSSAKLLLIVTSRQDKTGDKSFATEKISGRAHRTVCVLLPYLCRRQ